MNLGNVYDINENCLEIPANKNIHKRKRKKYIWIQNLQK